MKFILLLVFAYFLSTAKSHSKIFDAKSFTLKNGLQVVVIENNRAPIITSMIWYDVGSMDEEYGKSGVAHFLEHLMFKGTKKYPGGYFSNFISRNGGTQNAFTSFDYTAYFQTISSDKIEKILELEADRMKNLVLTQGQIESERNVILEERNQRIDSDPSSMLDEKLRSTLFLNHTYGRPIIGWKHEIEQLKYEDVFNFYKKFYRPSNAKLILSGNINEEKAKKIAKKYFAKIYDSPKSIKRIDLEDPPSNVSVVVTLNNENIKQRIWKRFYKTSSVLDSIKKAIALDIGLKIVAGGNTSILYEKIVKELKLASMIGGYYQGFTKGEGTIYFYAVPNKGIKIETLQSKISEILTVSIKKGIQKENFDLQKKKYKYDAIYQRDSISQPAQILGEALSIGLSLDEIENWNQYLDEISIQDVNNELKEFLKNNNFVTGILGELNE